MASLELDNVEAGTHNYVWDGKSANGERAANGLYSVRISASNGEQAVTASALEFGQVSGVMRGPKGTDFQVGSLGVFRFDDIKQIL